MFVVKRLERGEKVLKGYMKGCVECQVEMKRMGRGGCIRRSEFSGGRRGR